MTLEYSDREELENRIYNISLLVIQGWRRERGNSVEGGADYTRWYREDQGWRYQSCILFSLLDEPVLPPDDAYDTKGDE